MTSHHLLTASPHHQKQTAAAVVIHTRFVDLAHLQEKWNQDVIQVFNNTQPQIEDAGLLLKWIKQLTHISQSRQRGALSCIPGHFNFHQLIPDEMCNSDMAKEDVFHSDNNDWEDDDSDEDDGGIGETGWVRALDLDVLDAALENVQIDDLDE